MLTVYLDQYVWVALSKSRKESGDQSPEFARLRALRDSGLAKFVLSAANYLETWHRRNPASRHALASTMRELSHYDSIAPVQKMRALEVDALVRALSTEGRGIIAPLASEEVFRKGVNHAFDSPTGRLRLVDSLWTPAQNEGEPSDPNEIQTTVDMIEALDPSVYEWWSLAGPGSDTAQLPLEYSGQHRHGTDYVATQNTKREWYDNHPEMLSEMSDIIALEVLTSLAEVFNESMVQHGMSQSTGPQWRLDRVSCSPPAQSWLSVLPTAACEHQMIYRKMRNKQWKWQQHDYTDIGAIAVTLPYVDILVTEKQWCHELRSAGLAKSFDTRLVSNLTGLMDLLPHV